MKPKSYTLDAWLTPRSILKDLIVNHVRKRYREAYSFKKEKFTFEEPLITFRELEEKLKIPRPLIIDLLSELDMKCIIKTAYSHKLKDKIIKLKVSLEELDEIMSSEA